MLQHADRLLLYYVVVTCALGIALMIWERWRYTHWTLLSGGTALFLAATGIFYLVVLRHWGRVDTPFPGHRDLLWLPRIAYAVGSTLLVVGYGRRVWRRNRRRAAEPEP